MIRKTLSELLKDAPPSLLSPRTASHAGVITSVFCDSREAARHGASGLFVCIGGAAFDGHDFADAAYRDGCRTFAVSRPLELPTDAVQLVYKDTRRALASLSAAFYGSPSRELTVVGITGTKGKTTTALIAYSLLRELGIPVGYIGTIGIFYGDRVIESKNTTPESLILQKTMRDMVDCGVRVLLMEVSSQALMLDRVYGISFDTAVYTNLSPDHIGPHEHPSFEAYKREKQKLFLECGARHVLLNADDPHATDMLPRKADTEVVTLSVGGTAISDRLPAPTLRAENVLRETTADGRPGISFDVVTENGRIPAILSLPGSHNVYNALAALAICRTVGAELERAVAALASVTVPGRCETVKTANGVRVVIDYAHNEVSLREILTTLRPYTEGRLIVLFGSVGGRTQNRRAPMGRVASELADLVVLTADNPDREPIEDILADIRDGFTTNVPSVEIPNRRDAIEYALSVAKKGDTLLLAGKGHETYQLVNGERLPFSERKTVESFCKVGAL